ncbi:MAG: adenosylmethionine decarboxylase [Acidobacteria bacterium]|nr:adenosylmethionine decarboxylase [Acidobacteriota bacterium]
MRALGRHLLAEFSGCDAGLLSDLHHVTTAMLAAVEASGATVITHNFHHFSPLGVSGAVIIAESHLAIHTWPEYRFAAVDFFTCVARVEPRKALAVLKEALKAEDLELLEYQRGPLRKLELCHL